MILVILEIECIENKIVKELGVYKIGQTVGYFFLPSKKVQSYISVCLVYKASSWNQLEQWQ